MRVVIFWNMCHLPPGHEKKALLRPLMNNTDLTVKNSVEFCEQMKNVKLKEGDELLSFDVISLFTSIPVGIAIQVATDVLSNDETLLDRSTIPVDDIVDLLDFCLSTTNFNYNDAYYQQILEQPWVPLYQL